MSAGVSRGSEAGDRGAEGGTQGHQGGQAPQNHLVQHNHPRYLCHNFQTVLVSEYNVKCREILAQYKVFSVEA